MAPEPAADDWRVHGATRLKGCFFRLKGYYRWSEQWTHDHCSACWATFSDHEGHQHEGYAVTEEYVHGGDYAWVCKECFQDLREMMHWRVVD